MRDVSPAKLVTEEIVSGYLDYKLERTYVYFEFASDDTFENASIVIPSAGTVTATASEQGVNYGTFSGGSDIDVTLEDYARPRVSGSFSNIKAVPVIPIAGATHWRMIVARY